MNAQIKAIAEARKIPHLLHFTRARNLRSILQHGLYPVSRFGEIDLSDDVINDPLRLDGHLDGISVSIGFPNSQMFYRCRMDHPGDDWVILGIAPLVLWTKKCAFCRHNAADGRISCQSVASLASASSFSELFEEIEGTQSRAEQKLRSYDPTDVQAEVLVFDVIEPTLIGGVAFSASNVQAQYSDLLKGKKSVLNRPDKGYFASRRYALKAFD